MFYFCKTENLRIFYVFRGYWKWVTLAYIVLFRYCDEGLVEAVSTIIWATPRLSADCPELRTVRTTYLLFSFRVTFAVNLIIQVLSSMIPPWVLPRARSPANIYLFKVNNKNTRKKWNILKVNSKNTRTTSLTEVNSSGRNL